MKKLIECKNCESSYSLTYQETEVIGDPITCPFCNETLEDDIPELEDEDPLDTEEDWVEVE